MRRPLRVLLACVLAAGGLLATAGCGSTRNANRTPQSTDVYELAKLATVMVIGDYKGQVSVPVPTLSSAWIKAAEQRTQAAMLSHQIPATKEAGVNYIIQLLVQDPLHALVPTSNVQSLPEEITSMGSGFFVTADGYLLTNAHVVSPDGNEMKRTMAEAAMGTFLKEIMTSLQQSLGAEMTPAMAKDFQNAFLRYMVQYVSIGQIAKAYQIKMGAAVPGVAAGQKGIGADVVQVGAPVPGKDVAVLKIEGEKNLPTLPLTDESSMRVTDPVFIVGYPASATLMPALAKESQLEPTLTKGVISRTVKMDSGWTALQTDANSHPGNSGGPALNAGGSVVGLLTFGALNKQGQLDAGANFLVPTSLAMEFLNRANVKPAESVTTQQYRQALYEYDDKHYSNALKIFQAVSAYLPGNPFVQNFIADSTREIAAGHDKTPSPLMNGRNAAIAAAVLVALFAVYWFGLRRRVTPVVGARVTVAGSATPVIAATPVATPIIAATPVATPIAPPPVAQPLAATASAPAAEGLRCAQCGAALQPAQRFCPECGAAAVLPPAKRVCPRCGREGSPTERFCSDCGAPLGDA